MIQVFIVYLIISIALSALMLKTLHLFNIIGKKSVNSSKCAGCSTGCEMKGLHQFKKEQTTGYDQYRMQL